MNRRLALLAAASAALFALPAAAAKKDWSALPVTPLEVGAGVSASLDAEDLDDKVWRDWYLVSAEAGETLTFTIEGGGEEPHLWLYRAQGRDEPVSLKGALLASGWKREFSYPVRESGQYLLSVTSRYKPGGAYRVLAASDRRTAHATAPQPPTPVATASVERVEIDPARWTLNKPVYVHPGELVAGEISPVDAISGVERSGDVLTFQARAGEVITAQVRSDIPSLLVAFRPARSTLRLSPLAEGSARDAPVRFVAPKDDTYQIYVHTQGPNRYGKYLLSIGTDQGAPPLDPPKAPPPVQVAEVPKPAPSPMTPAPKPAPPPKPAGPAPIPKLTPPPGVMAAEIGKSIARPAGKPGMKVDLYAFIGEAGAVVEANAVGAGGYGITLYTPEGAEMLRQSGLGVAKLSAVLPQDAVYILAVARQDAAKPYKLSLTAQPPDIFQWAFRQGAGYEILDDASGKVLMGSCWVTPGMTLRFLYPSGSTADMTLQPGGAGRMELKSGSNAFTTRFDGVRFTRTFAIGRPSEWSLEDPPPRLGAYKGYLCP